MAVAYGLTSCSSGLVPKSWLLHSPEVHDGFVPKHSLHRGKTPPFGLKNRNSQGCDLAFLSPGKRGNRRGCKDH